MSVAAELLDKGYDPDAVRDFAKHGVDMAQALTFTELASVLDDVLQRTLEDYDTASDSDLYVLYGGSIGHFKDDVKTGVLRAVLEAER
jgi:hypothetical protein